MSDLVFKPATEMLQLLRARKISAVELMDAHLRQIERVNPKVNAIITLLPDRAMQGAREADARFARGERLGHLDGLPVAIKDLQETAGIRTTYGSLIFSDHVPQFDTLTVSRLKSAGAIIIGKTNTPEFGAGSQTFNQVFGATRNPYHLDKTCGGSSGGAAVSLATGMLPIADGSDLGGSLRNPASFCNVVGFRSSPGRVPIYPRQHAWSFSAVDGPMARTVADVALMLGAMAGPDPRVPISLSEPGARFAQPLTREFVGARIAWLGDLGLPFDPRVTNTVNAQRGVFESLGCVIDDAAPDFSGADEVFKTQRAYSYAMSFAALLDKHHDTLKDTVIWNIEQGLKLTARDLISADVKRTALWHRVREFMQTHEFMILPVAQVPPFDVSTPYIDEINGVKLPTYIDWMSSCYFITVLGLPAISVPCGFTADGLPVGVQIVGRHHDDYGVLQLAHAFEQATQFWKQRPDIA